MVFLFSSKDYVLVQPSVGRDGIDTLRLVRASRAGLKPCLICLLIHGKVIAFSDIASESTSRQDFTFYK